MKKLSKLEWILILTILFFIFVYIGIQKKYGIDVYENLLKNLGLIKESSFPKSAGQFFDLFLYGIGVKKRTN